MEIEPNCHYPATGRLSHSAGAIPLKGNLPGRPQVIGKSGAACPVARRQPFSHAESPSWISFKVPPEIYEEWNYFSICKSRTRDKRSSEKVKAAFQMQK
jgi:hypothetical protein